MRLAEAQNTKKALETQLRDVEAQIESLLDRIVEATSPTVVSAYEARIERLERDKIVLSERVENVVPPEGRLEGCIEHALRFLSSPWKFYKNGDYVMRQTVLRLAFLEPLRYGHNGVYGTPKIAFPFKALAGISGKKSEMVRLERESLNSLFDTLQEWEIHLAQHDLSGLRCDDDTFAP